MSFIDYLNDKKDIKIDEKIDGINEIGVDFVVTKALFMSTQAHIWHLLAKTGQKHVALKELYDELSNNADSLAEKFIAQGGMFVETRDFTFKCTYDNYDIIEQINLFRSEITTLIDHIKDNAELFVTLDDLVDFQEIIDSFIYKFNLE